MRHTNSQIVYDEEKANKLSRKAFYVNENEFYDESGEIVGYEVKMRKRTVFDNKPIHVSCAILQWSKILFLRFMYFLFDHLEPGSFRASYCDTDSICLGLRKVR